MFATDDADTSDIRWVISTVQELATSEWMMFTVSALKRQSSTVHTFRSGDQDPTVRMLGTYPLPAGTTVNAPNTIG